MSAENAGADVLVVGGGIVGLASAHCIQQRLPGTRVTVLEKEPEIALHQTGRNSGVIHSGIYYKPGSQKARNCREGKKLLEEFCTEERIPFELCGKVVVVMARFSLKRTSGQRRFGMSGHGNQFIEMQKLCSFRR